jgi:hypothetical protein
MTRRARATESDAPPERLAYRVDEARPGGAAPPPFSAMNSTPGHSKASNDPRPYYRAYRASRVIEFCTSARFEAAHNRMGRG